MSKNTKFICVGHKPPDFTPLAEYLMLCPSSLNMTNEIVISDDRFGKEVDGASFAEYSQLFGLAELINSGDIKVDALYLFQYRKFLSPLTGGFDSIAEWVKILSPRLAIDLFPQEAIFEEITNDLIVGSIFNFGESISDNYSKAHVTEDLVTFSAACFESGELSNSDIKQLASMRGIIPSPALCYIKVDLFLEIMKILENVCMVFIKNYYTKREGYQSRSTGYLLERLHSLIICQKILNGQLSESLVWNRYVINTEI
jgi:hypothetical protein